MERNIYILIRKKEWKFKLSLLKLHNEKMNTTSPQHVRKLIYQPGEIFIDPRVSSCKGHSFQPFPFFIIQLK